MKTDHPLASTDDSRLRLVLPAVTPSLADQVYASILEAISSGQIPPGERLNQDELAATLKVSRQPVTQALGVLKMQEFVQDAGRRGLVVAPLRKGFFESLYQLRESLDPMAARLAARHHKQLSRDAAERIMAAGRQALASGAVAELTSADMAFHMWLYESAGNPLLAEMLRMYWHHLRRAMMVVVGPARDRRRVWQEHAAIVEAVLKGDEKRAESLSLKHIQGAAQRVVSTVPE